MKPLLAIEDLTVALPPGADRPHAIEGATLEVRSGEIQCVVGESGSGKSMMANAVMRLLPEGVAIAGGRVLLDGDDLTTMSEAALRRIRGRRIAMVFQEPMTALNPLRTIGDQIAEMFTTHTPLRSAEISERVEALLGEVHIPHPREAAGAYPHELSGGQRQRAMIAMALALEPAVLIADEPTTALDVTTQAQILKLIRELQQSRGTGVLLITHDFGVVAEIADRVAVMQLGRIVEQAPARQLLARPQHPYTRALVAAVPSLTPPPPRKLGKDIALAVENVSKTYRARALLSRSRRETKALDKVSIALPRGGTLAVVGESGSGKSTLARCIVRLIDPDAGAIRIGDIDMALLSRRRLRQEARRIQMVFQDPFASLNPRRRAGELVAQGPIAHGVPRAEAMAQARELFALVGLDPAATERFPHEFSGGQRQRIGLARALALKPDILVADEPVSALDVSVQAQVLRLLQDLRERLALSMIFITHDLRVAAQVADRIAVMKDGIVVEEGPTAQVYCEPRHAYTRALLDAIPGRALGSVLQSGDP